MLRREPTRITLTMDDIANFDARKAQKDQEKQYYEEQASQAGDAASEDDTFSNSNAPAIRRGVERDARSRDQRIGVGNSRT